jgi:flavin-dependent thymidylate synthase
MDKGEKKMKNKVSLQGWYGGDKTHAQAAWYSTYRKGQYDESKSDAYDKRIKRIPALLKMLAENEHGTPFERSLLHFSATVDTATHIQILKHRHFSVNGESARYKEYTEDKYYIPVDWDEVSGKNLKDDTEEAYESYHCAVKYQEEKLNGRKRAKESARYFLPYAIQVNLDFSCNFRAFVHFQKLRNSEHAQLEIREIAAEMLRLVQEETNGDFQHSLSAFGLE